MHVVVAPDKFRGTASAGQVAAAIEEAVIASKGTAVTVPMADGGEGTLEALGGQNQTSLVTGPLGDLVEAPCATLWQHSSYRNGTSFWVNKSRRPRVQQCP